MQIRTIILCIALVVCTYARYNPQLIKHERRNLVDELLHERSYDNHNEPSERDSNVMRTVSYVTLPYASPGIAPIDDIIALGMNGFLFVKVATTGPRTYAFLFAKVDGSDATYLYHFNPRPKDIYESETMYEREGADGYRYRAELYNGTNVLYAFVKDTSRPIAHYIFQYLPYPSDPATVINDRIEAGKNGYITASCRFGYNLTIFMKDLFYETQYEFIPAPNVNSSAEFLLQANDLAEQGYLFFSNYLRIITTYSGSQKIIELVYFNMYVKNLGRPNKKFSYRVMVTPTSASDYASQMAEMGQAGFFVFKDMGFPADNNYGTVFVDLNKDQYDPVDLDPVIFAYYS